MPEPLAPGSFSRRALFATAALPLLSADALPEIPRDLIARHDRTLDDQLAQQITDPRQRYCGGYPNEDGLFFAGIAGGIALNAAAAFLTPGSRHYRSSEVAARLRLAAAALPKFQNGQGNVDLVVTNFNSPPDTGFSTHVVASAAVLLQRAGERELFATLVPFLKKAGEALTVGGVHTPNHRWVVSQALAQLNEVLPDARYVRRIDQWLAEGVDMDADGQYTERSTAIYNVVSNRALATIALKLKRPELFEPVRRNLEAMLYLLHADGEVETGISRRQDRFTAGNPSKHWFALRIMALLHSDGRFAALARRYEKESATLPLLLEFDELRRALSADAPLPDNYVRTMKAMQCQRVRRGPTSITAYGDANSRFLTMRHGGCVIEAVRVASAFFGKGQFRAERFAVDADGALRCAQHLEGNYWQPFAPARTVRYDEYDDSRPNRPKSEIEKLDARIHIVEKPGRVEVEFVYEGTPEVPYAIEIALRPGGVLEGATKYKDVYLLVDGGHATYRVGDRAIRIGPGASAHRYVEVRGAEPRLPFTSLYVCGITPERRVVSFEFL